LPGTALFHRLKEQNKIVLNNYPGDWQQYDNMMAIVNTSNLDREELDSVMREIWYSLYNKQAMRKKMFRTLWNTKSFKTAYWSYASAHNYGRMFLERFIHTDPDGLDEKLEWKKKKRSFYLKFTDIIIWLIYQVSWGKTVNRMSGNNGKLNG
jgi:hypothetical protein